MREPVTRAMEACPVEVAVAVLGGAWKLTAVKELQAGVLRSGELSRRMPGAPPRTLTRALRELEADGVVERTIHPEVPPRVEYGLTPLGESLQDVVRAMNAWGEAYPGPMPGRPGDVP